ncbi:MAG: ChbG/HpnK family deacetylase [Acidobacteria bacterium]|nr:ChbG/HpnK family deacetylase [Acidobacteriota bacterium]MBV9147442.1 ChbG/HpnK family deacetylase [Acidobacteriota bacterium]
MPRLIVNADDFGMTSGVNRAIVESHRSGIVTSATVMANEHAVAEVKSLLAEFPGLATGCHVVLVDGIPLSPAANVESLIGSRNGNGVRFRPNITQLAIAAAAGRLKEKDAHAEAGAQIERLQSMGLSLSHVDCHMHSHILPAVTRAVLKAAREHGISAVRNPFEPGWAVAATHKFSSPRSWNRSAQVTLLRALQPKFVEVVRRHGMKTTDGTIGIAVTGLLDRELLHKLIEAMPEGTWELVTHPGYNDTDLANATTSLKQSRAVELALLTSAETRELLNRRGIRLINFREL